MTPAINKEGIMSVIKLTGTGVIKTLLTPTTAYINGSTIANRQWAY